MALARISPSKLWRGVLGGARLLDRTDRFSADAR